ncbi:MAG: hypothetical protein RLZZ385_1229 [Pseudomonadota bacterium]|jgi:hypothetical protein
MSDINLLNWIEVIALMGVPMVCLSWLIFRWLYLSGEIDRDANHKLVAARVKEMKQGLKASSSKQANFLYKKWMWFGSGFYGLAGLWTFFVIEMGDLFGFLLHPVVVVTRMQENFVEFLISVGINQLTNLLSAFLWFTYWTDSGDSIVLWIAIAWLGYWVGNKLARRDVAAHHLNNLEARLVEGARTVGGLLTKKKGDGGIKK